jgi:glucose/arabinose dehydrogenase
MRMQPDGKAREIFATGLRNSVGFDWAPWDDALYATENGRDLLGDDLPPDELNRIERGGFYGWPFAFGARVADPDMGKGHEADIARSIPPAHEFRAHNAPLGIAFLRGTALPPGYSRTALVALHGSWNRSVPDGYKVVALDWQADGSIVERDFLSGFRSSEGIIGRPAGVTQGPDGAIYITDDYAAFGHLSAAQRAALLAQERELLAEADLTIVTAPRLLELKAPHARRIELIPNGVDLAPFQSARQE